MMGRPLIVIPWATARNIDDPPSRAESVVLEPGRGVRDNCADGSPERRSYRMTLDRVREAGGALRIGNLGPSHQRALMQITCPFDVGQGDPSEAAAPDCRYHFRMPDRADKTAPL